MHAAKKHFFYSLGTGNCFCGECLTGEPDTMSEYPTPTGYEPVPEEHFEGIICENCGAIHTENHNLNRS